MTPKLFKLLKGIHRGCLHYLGYLKCRNPNLDLWLKQKLACKGANQEWSSGVTFHAPGIVGEYEGMNPHTPKWIFILGVGVSMDS